MKLPAPVRILDVGVHPVTRLQLIDILVEWALGKYPRTAFHVNAHALNLAYQDREFRDCLDSSDLVYCDGFGAKWAARMLGHRLPDRMTPPDWIDDFLRLLPAEAPVFLLGDEAKVVSACAELMTEKHRVLQMAGTHHGFFDSKGAENQHVSELISKSGARVLLVGMGMPRQELWIESNLKSLNISVALPVGALFQYYAGAKRRAPRWITDHGLEWLGRLAHDPSQTFYRYVVGNPRFVARVLRERLS